MPAKKHLRVTMKQPNARGGCLCSPHAKIVDCKPPYIVFEHAGLMVHPNNKVPVICLECAQYGARKAAQGKRPAADETEAK